MSTSKAGKASPEDNYAKQETKIEERASSPTSDSDNDSTRAQLGKKHKYVKLEPHRPSSQYSAEWNPNSLAEGSKNDRASASTSNPFAERSANYFTNPFTSSNAQKLPSSSQNPFAASPSSTSTGHQAPIGHPPERSLPYAPGFSSTFIPASTSNTPIVTGTTAHSAPHHHAQYQNPVPFYPDVSNYAVPPLITPNYYAPPPQLTSPYYFPPAYHPPPSYYLTPNHNPGAFPSHQSVPQYPHPPPKHASVAGHYSAPYDDPRPIGPDPRLASSNQSATSTPANTVAFSSPDDNFASFLSGNVSAPTPNKPVVPSPAHSRSVPKSPDSHSALSIPDGPIGSGYALPVSNLLADLSLVENEVLPKGDFITQWQDATRTVEDAAEEITIQKIYHACMECYHVMLPSWYKALGGKDAIKHALYRNHILLRDWGTSYAVLDGQLDQLPKEAEDITETILSFLVEISTILIQRIPKLTGHMLSVGKSTHTQEAQIQPILLSNASLTRTIDTEQEAVDEDVDSEEDSWSLCLDELHDYVQLLNELHPSIESWVSLREQSPEPTSADVVQQSVSRIYSEMVRTKFSDAPEELVDALGDLNYKRYVRLADARNEQFAEVEEVLEVEVLPEKSASFHDSGIGSSLPVTETVSTPSQAPSRALSQALSQSASQPFQAPTRTVFRAPSRASSFAFTLAGESRTKLPRLPKDAKIRPFACDYCGVTVSYRTRKEYERHLIQDLQPYSCLETDCPSTGEIFPTRQSWVKHLQSKHGIETNSPARHCHLCGKMTESGMVAICRHFADHLENIAIAASPMDIDSDDDSDAGSMESHGHLAEEKDKLQTITEDDEEISETGAEINVPDAGAPAETTEDDAVPTVDVVSGIIDPNCAICNKPKNLPSGKCSCEADRLEIAVKQAQAGKMDDKLDELRKVSHNSRTLFSLTSYRQWVIQHTRDKILKIFSRLSETRKKTHSEYLASLPNYDIYMRYSGRPPINPLYIANLQSQIQEAHEELKRGIDADWRVALLRYPEGLDYYYSLAKLDIPEESDERILQYKLKADLPNPVLQPRVEDYYSSDDGDVIPIRRSDVTPKRTTGATSEYVPIYDEPKPRTQNDMNDSGPQKRNAIYDPDLKQLPFPKTDPKHDNPWAYPPAWESKAVGGKTKDEDWTFGDIRGGHKKKKKNREQKPAPHQRVPMQPDIATKDLNSVKAEAGSDAATAEETRTKE